MSVEDEARRILAFYEGSAPDDRGRMLGEVLAFDDAALESTHDFIQWLFPLRDRSRANPDAPVLDGKAIEVFRKRSELRSTLRRSLDRMLSFYGLRRDGERIVRSASFEKRSHWLTPGNHNHLRLTRMLLSLRTLGLESDARALLDCLLHIAEDDRRNGQRRISDRTLNFWRSALDG
jgi:hypothetical protein